MNVIKKYAGLVMLTAICVATAVPAAIAANPDTFVINVACQRTLSVNVTTGTADGAQSYNASLSSTSLPTGRATVLPTPLYVWNDSPADQAAVQNYGLQVTNGAASLSTNAWSLSGSGEIDKFVVAALFSAAAATPTTADFTTDTTDSIPSGSIKSWAAAGGAFSPVTVGYRYSAGLGETRHARNTNLGAADLRLWIGIGTPLAVTSTGANAAFTVTVTAQ